GRAAGARAWTMLHTAGSLPPLEGPITGVTIPFLGARPGDQAALQAADGQTVTITDGPALANPGFRATATFTSGGPRFGDSAVKPDVAAPGVSVKSAFAGSGTQGQLLSGTPMPTPRTEGLAG